MRSPLALGLFALLFLVSAVFSNQLARLDLAPEGTRVEGEYIVVFKKDLSPSQFLNAVKNLKENLLQLNYATRNEVIRTYDISAHFRGAHLRLDSDGLLAVRTHPDVDYVVEDAVVTLNQGHACYSQEDVIWNLDRINTHDINLDQDIYRYGHAGENVDVYVIDTGVLTTHDEFEGRAFFGANFVPNDPDDDCNGHGTHVAGTIAGRKWGVAKKATVWAVKVLSCSGGGQWSGVIGGIDWTAKSATSRGRPSVANMSLGGGVNAAINQAVAAAVQMGVTMVVAAGNNNANACSFSPASEPLAITVAATTIEGEEGSQKDRRTSFSNYGPCVDIAAPGQLIQAAWINIPGVPDNTAHKIISGTSMASPHVAGSAAIVLSANPKLRPADVEAALLKVSTNGMIDMACTNDVCNQTPNSLLYTHCDQ